MDKCKNCTCEHWTDDCSNKVLSKKEIGKRYNTIKDSEIFDGIEQDETDYADSTND